MTASEGSPFMRSGLSLALGKIRTEATYCPDALQQITAVSVVLQSADERTPTLFFLFNLIILDDLLGTVHTPASLTLTLG
jgi:hypothetical protein